MLALSGQNLYGLLKDIQHMSTIYAAYLLVYSIGPFIQPCGLSFLIVGEAVPDGGVLCP